MACETVASTV